jgi:predicted  nucleic acid-binding Zn-ribbon protein
METPQAIVMCLRELNELEQHMRKVTSPAAVTRAKAKMALKRALLPAAILQHHDRMWARNKPSVAPVRNWTCRGCHLTVHRGLHRRLQVMTDLVLCENCGSFMYLDETPDLPPAPVIRQVAPVAKKRATAPRAKVAAKRRSLARR